MALGRGSSSKLQCRCPQPPLHHLERIFPTRKIQRCSISIPPRTLSRSGTKRARQDQSDPRTWQPRYMQPANQPPSQPQIQKKSDNVPARERTGRRRQAEQSKQGPRRLSPAFNEFLLQNRQKIQEDSHHRRRPAQEVALAAQEVVALQVEQKQGRKLLARASLVTKQQQPYKGAVLFTHLRPQLPPSQPSARATPTSVCFIGSVKLQHERTNAHGCGRRS